LKYCFAILILLFSLGLKAQGKPQINNFYPPSDSTSFAFILSTGSTGLGVHYALKVASQFNLRAGFSLLTLSGIDWRPTGMNLSRDRRTQFTCFQLVAQLEYYPRERRRFKWIVGMSHFDNLSLTGFYNYNPFIQEFQSGLRVSNNGAALFLGLGWGDLIPTKTMGLSVNLGVQYLGKPKVEIEDSSQLLFGSLEEANQFKQNMSKFLFLPQIEICLSLKP
tara:strand:+ start:62518 stop:63180 length:663 start_codon:yes stop_codon:yes gene_type:complete